MLFAWVAKQAFHGHKPENPLWQGSTPFKSFVVMDDPDRALARGPALDGFLHCGGVYSQHTWSLHAE